MTWPGEHLYEQVWSQSSNPILVDASTYNDTHIGIWGFTWVVRPGARQVHGGGRPGAKCKSPKMWPDLAS